MNLFILLIILILIYFLNELFISFIIMCESCFLFQMLSFFYPTKVFIDYQLFIKFISFYFPKWLFSFLNFLTFLLFLHYLNIFINSYLIFKFFISQIISKNFMLTFFSNFPLIFLFFLFCFLPSGDHLFFILFIIQINIFLGQYYLNQ